MKARIFLTMLITSSLFSMTSSALAENLYTPNAGAALASDIKASNVGDILTVIIVQSAEARNTARNTTDRSTRASGALSVPGARESLEFSLGRNYSGVGEVRRSETFLTQMSATVQGIHSNGDLQIEGSQFLQINGETTEIMITGRIRPADVTAENTVLSSRVADAKIRYDGEGFVSDSARPGLLTRIFNALGLI